MKKKFLQLIVLLLFASATFAQNDLVITEIMYNPPESGTDSLEFIELFNNTSSTIDLTGYSFTSGITYTFPTILLNSGDYLLVAVDSIAMFNTFGVTAYQWTSGGLSNSGESIVLVDSSANQVDSVNYDDIAPWPTTPDGFGPSLTLCDPSLSNETATNWSASIMKTGIFSNGFEILATPGAACFKPATTVNLFFSEYAEGSSNNKYIELFNGSANSVDLHDFLILQNSNGGPIDEYVDTMTGMLASGDVYVFANSGANPFILAQADAVGTGVCYHNGDDARALAQVVTDGSQTDTITFDYNADGNTEDVYVVILDYIGTFPIDPGSGWDVAGITNATQDHTLVRKLSVTTGNTDWAASAGTDGASSEWIVMQKDYWLNIGSHSTPIAPLSTVKMNDVNGEPLYKNLECMVMGNVQSANFRSYANGYGTFVHDGTSGTYIYKSNNAFVTYPTSNIGDSIIMLGTISSYKGLTQFAPDSIVKLGTAYMTNVPTVTSILGEDQEAEVITIKDLKLIDPSQWSTGTYGRYIDATNGVDTFTIYIETACELHGTPAPIGMFDITGLGYQKTGYYIMPSLKSDLFVHPSNYMKLVINEFMAKSDVTNDWIEIFNPNMTDVSLKDWYLSDSRADSLQWQFPDTIIPAQGFLLVWDENEITDLHCNFKLSKEAEEVVLTNPDMEVVDFIAYVDQHVDTSYARIPNGYGVFKYAVPTPGSENSPLPKIIPMYDIDQIVANDANGSPDSLGVECYIQGVVYGTNYRAYKPGLQFVLHDGTDGIWVYLNAGDLGYTFREGDELKMKGKVAFYNGLTEFGPTEIEVVDSNKTLDVPTLVTAMDEMNEAELVKFERVWLVDTNQWPTPTDLAVNVQFTNGNDTMDMRIVTDCNLHGTAPRADTFNIVGLVGQYDYSSPYFDGYQLFPRYMEDITEWINAIPENDFSDMYKLYPNPNNGSFNLVNKTNSTIEITIFNSIGQIVYNNMHQETNVELNITNADAGIYFVMVNNLSNNSISTGKIIVR